MGEEATLRVQPWDAGADLNVVPDSRETELLDVVTRYLTGADAAELAVPELREPERVLALALHDMGYEHESTVASLAVKSLAGTEATVDATRTVVPTGRHADEEYEQHLTVHLVDRDGWKIRDVVADGRSALASLHRVTVEPSEAEGLRISAWAQAEAFGDVVIAVSVRNDTDRRWRLKCAGATWRRGPLWLISQLGSRALGRGGAVDYEPGTEHGFMLRVPPKVERLWLKATPRHGLRSLLFALSWEAAAEASPASRRIRQAVPVALAAIPVVAIGVFVGLTRSVAAAILVSSLLVAIPLLTSHCCVLRLERKLARLRAELARSPAR
jgi:hypothetical protein